MSHKNQTAMKTKVVYEEQNYRVVKESSYHGDTFYIQKQGKKGWLPVKEWSDDGISYGSFEPMCTYKKKNAIKAVGRIIKYGEPIQGCRLF